MKYMSNFKEILANLYYLNHPLISGFSALYAISLGVFVLLKNKQSKIHQALFWLTFVLSIWFFGNALSMFYFNNLELAIFWFKFAYTTVPFISLTFYNFYLVYSGKKNEFFYPLIYVICILEILYLWFSNDIRIGVYALPNVGLIYQRMSPFFYFLIFGMIKYIILTTATAIFSWNEFKKETDFFKKTRLKWLTISFFVIILGLLEWLVAFDIPLHIGWFPLLLFISILAYTILKYQLMDINILIKKGLIYSVVIALISGFLVGASFLSSWLAGIIPGFQFWIVPLLTAITTFVIGNLFWRKSKQIEKAYEVEKKAVEELKALNQAKDEFILITQHHLRTPLTIMKGYLDVILNKFQDKVDPKALEYVDKVAKSTNRLTRIANEFLDITQFQIGKGLLKIEPTNPYSLIKEILDELQPEIEKKKLFVKINPEPKDWFLVPADSQKFKQALFNIIDNAIKYTPVGGVTITLEKNKDKAILVIGDTGIGLSAEDLKHLFVEVFERSKEARIVFPVGRGVGLFVTARIIKIHQGRIWAESE